jgi:hypothetical protein
LIFKLSPISEMASTVMFGNFLPTKDIMLFFKSYCFLFDGKDKLKPLFVFISFNY